MDERRKPKQIMEARVEGTRTRGRPRKGYMDRIEDIARKKGKGVKLVPIQNYVLSARVSEENESRTVTEVEKDHTYELSRKFGTKRSKRTIEQYEHMRTDADLMEQKLKEISANVVVDSGILESQREVKERDYMPPVNRNAERLEDVYKLSDILTSKEMDLLKQEAVQIMTNPEKYEKSSFTSFFGICLENLSTLEPDKEKLLEGVAILVYVELLLKFLHANAKVVSSKYYSSCSFSKEIHDRIMEDFTITSANGRTRPLAMRDKIICYIIVLALIVNKYRLNLEYLVAERIPKTRLHHLSSLLGTVKGPKDANVIILRLPLPPVQKRESMLRKKKVSRV
ncbi:hypothetical protein C0J52_12818 [Blattella germanica]|nr:hypothetical protein C0J52_12818 [Blattella germanica]